VIKFLRKIHLKGENIYIGTQFQRFHSMVTWGAPDRGKLFISWQPGSRNRVEGVRVPISSSRSCPSDETSFHCSAS
jgi:hypothetical protein